MAESKLSTTPIITNADLSQTDTVLVLDKSATTGDQSGPEGTWKQAPVSAFRQIGTIKGVVHNLSLVGMDLTKPFLEYIADAINAYGPFNGVAGELMLFRTYQQVGDQYNYSVITTYYKVTHVPATCLLRRRCFRKLQAVARMLLK